MLSVKLMKIKNPEKIFIFQKDPRMCFGGKKSSLWITCLSLAGKTFQLFNAYRNWSYGDKLKPHRTKLLFFQLSNCRIHAAQAVCPHTDEGHGDFESLPDYSSPYFHVLNTWGEQHRRPSTSTEACLWSILLSVIGKWWQVRQQKSLIWTIWELHWLHLQVEIFFWEKLGFVFYYRI